VKRCDVAGDWFGPVTPWRSAALSARWPRSRSIPQANIWSTTIGGHGHNQVCIYDKGIESGLKTPDKHGRCEVRAHSNLPALTVSQLHLMHPWWIEQVRMIGAPSPAAVLKASPKDQCLVHAMHLHPELTSVFEAFLRSPSRSMVTRIRRLMKQSRSSGLGDDLVELCLAA